MKKKTNITGITLKLYQANEVTISLAEARELYRELHELFKEPGLTFPSKPVYPYGGIPRTPWPYDIWCKTNTNTVDPSTYVPLRQKVFIKGA